MPIPSSDRALASDADYKACRDLLRNGSKSFFVASLLLPRRLKPSVYALYAFCRLGDDAVDGLGFSPAVLTRMHERLAAAYEGAPFDSPVDRAFADTVRAHAIPRELPEALLEGFAWDAAGRRYATLEDLRAYAARVAGTVGAMMAVLMGARGAEALARACDLGVAMQLTNIARDVGDDARAGRLYIPTQWFRSAGLDPEAWLRAPKADQTITVFVAKLLSEADRLYRRAEAGIALLPRDCRTAIWAARFIYAAIGETIIRAGIDPVSTRAVVTKGEKLRLLGRAWRAAHRPSASQLAGPLPETRFLIDAAIAAAGEYDQSSGGGSVVWLIELFDRLERHDRGRWMPVQQEMRAG